MKLNIDTSALLQSLTTLSEAVDLANKDYEKLRLEAQGYKADAERYRRLRNIGCVFWTDLGTNKEVKHQVCEQAMDETIDKAINESKK